MEILQKAKELGMLIAESEELKDLKESEELVKQDARSVELLNEQQKAHVELVKAIRSRAKESDIEAAKAVLTKKQQEINEYKVTRYFVDCKKAFDELIKNVNHVMTHEITGESSCEGGCDSCSGCK